MFRKLALRRSAEQHLGRVGSNVFGYSFRCLITSVHVDAMLCEPASTLTRSPTPMHLTDAACAPRNVNPLTSRTGVR